MRIYLDHNATSPAGGDHLSRVFHVLARGPGNPSSPHAAGREASVALTTARREIARQTGFDPGDVIFVSGGTEANNLGTTGVLAAVALPRGEAGDSSETIHAITTAIEHPSILEPLRAWEAQGQLALTVLAVDAEGRVAKEEIFAALRPQTRLVTLMAANNETGVVLPVRAFADALHEARWGKAEVSPQGLSAQVPRETLRALHFHVDGVQAFGKLPAAHWLGAGVDSVSLCAHKIGGLPGIGVLCLRRGRKYVPAQRGGAQEKNRRAGTENLAGVLSLGFLAADMALPAWWERVAQMADLLDQLRAGLADLPAVVWNTPRGEILPNTLNFSVVHPTLRGEDVLMELDMRGICASSGSACSSGANLPSKVLTALGRSDRQARDAIRLSLGRGNTAEEVRAALSVLHEILAH
jgi:cysteine desulfurase